MICRAVVEYLAPKFRAGLKTPIYTEADAARVAELTEKREAARRRGSEAGLTLMLAAVMFVPVAALMILSAPPAEADPVDEFTADNGITAVCEPLDADPTEETVSEIGAALQDQGFLATAGQIVADSVAVFCPHHMPLLQRYVSDSPIYV